MRKQLLFVAVLALTGAIVLAEEAPAAGSNSYAPKDFETKPGIFFYLFQDDSLWNAGQMSVIHRATADCLTPPVAMEMFFPEVAAAAGFYELDLQQALQSEDAPEDAPAIPADAAGISFWVKGDGSPNTGRVELRADYRAAGSGFDFPLSDSQWHRIVLKWSDFSPAPEAAGVQALGFGVKEGAARPTRYTIDALRFMKTADAEDELASLAGAVNSRQSTDVEIPARPAPSSCVYNKGAVPKTRAKIRNGQPTRWLAYGDSVTVPVQLWNIPRELIQTQYAYYAVAARILEAEYQTSIDIAVNAVGGRQFNEDFDGLPESLTTEKADLLILLSGDTIENYERLMPKVLAAAGAAGTEVLVVIPTYEGRPLRVPAFDWLKRFCLENNVACVDARSYLLGVPEACYGDTTANASHPNALGHRLIGQVLSEAFR